MKSGIKENIKIKLYAGDVPNGEYYNGLIGLSLKRENNNHIRWDLTCTPYPFDDNSVDFFQSEDVFEHINYTDLPPIFEEVFRILKPGALFRLSLPDYNCDVLYMRSLYCYAGDIIFDPMGGGTLENPGHVWFPKYDSVRSLISASSFHKHGYVRYLHYYLDKSNFVAEPIDYTLGYIQRTPDHDERVMKPYRPMSLVVDLYKSAK